MARKKEKQVIKPQPGPQTDFLRARRFCEELLLGGSRGGGKSYALLLDFASDVEEYGRSWQGVIFRQTYPQLAEIIKLSQEIFKPVFGDGCDYKVGSHEWVWKNGANLKLRHLDTDADYLHHHGHSFTFLGYDELTNWPTDINYKRMMSTLRSADPKVFKRVRATTNPSGPGMGWVKQRFIDPAPGGYKLIQDPETGMGRMFIPSQIQDNKILLDADPNYISRIRAATQGNEALMKAWLHGDWDVFFGQFFEMFSPQVHRVDPMTVLEPHGGVVPPHWRIEGGLDYGESQHTCFLLCATNEEGVSYVIDEYYHDGRWLDEHAGAIRALIEDCDWTRGRFPERIWADTRIFTTRAASGWAARNRMVSDVFKSYGLRLVKSNKDRLAGWRWLKNELAWKADPETGEMVKTPKIYYFPDCINLERELQESQYAGDESNPKEDLDERQPDHAVDSLRYFTMGSHRGRTVKNDRVEEGLTWNSLMDRRQRARMGLSSRQYGFVVTDEWKDEHTEVAY